MLEKRWPVWLEQSERWGEGRRGGQEGDEDKLCGAAVRHIALRARPSWVQVLDLLLSSWVTLGSESRVKEHSILKPQFSEV